MKHSKIVRIPDGAIIYGSGYVYVNVSSKYDPLVKYTRTVRQCIGKNIDGKSMYANKIYSALFEKNLFSEAPKKSDTISVGIHLLISQISEISHLDRALVNAFDEDEARLIKDLATFLLVSETSAFQHFPAFGYSNALFSDKTFSDSYISKFLQDKIRPTQIQGFQTEWADCNRGSGKAYLCYDSTNINCVSEGVELAQMGHAKDDATKPQVNVEYVVRQEDGLPLIYKDYPGSIVDITEASDMIETIQSLGYQDITVICDRGYISQENMESFDKAGINFLMMLRSNLKVNKKMIEKYGAKIRLRSEKFIPEHDLYGMTVRHRINNKGACRYFHIFWDQVSGEKIRKNIMRKVESIANELNKKVSKNRSLSEKDEKNYSKYFIIELEPQSRIVKSFQHSHLAIDKEVSAAGFFILISSEEMTCKEALDAYSKRDCVEKSFRALKTNIGMDTIRAHSDECAGGRLFVSFVASIMRAFIFHGLKELRIKDRKNFTVPASIQELKKIEVFRDCKTEKYSRRYKLTAKQKKIYAAFDLNESDVDEISKLF